MNDNISLYIHIPFCIRKCSYCDFLSFSDFSKAEMYKTALLREIELFKTDKKVKSIFIGGGTPSAVDSIFITEIVETINKFFSLNSDCEITIEANPGTLTRKKAADYKACGINRISMGVQSCNDRLLKLLGRIHNFDDFKKSYSIAADFFKNINLDLMFALPTQTMADWQNTLNIVVNDFKPTHISAYSLIIEKGTPFYDTYQPIDESLDRNMYWYAVDFLAQNGYKQYEISNFATENSQCKHNLVYWQGGDYKGFGLGAASLIGNKRLKNTENLMKYIKCNTSPVTEIIEMPLFEQMQEFVLLGLRCSEGIYVNEFKKRFNCDLITTFGAIFEKHKNNGLLNIEKERISLTRRGVDLSNMVFVDFV